jgi:hypothetical protein
MVADDLGARIAVEVADKQPAEFRIRPRLPVSLPQTVERAGPSRTVTPHLTPLVESDVASTVAVKIGDDRAAKTLTSQGVQRRPGSGGSARYLPLAVRNDGNVGSLLRVELTEQKIGDGETRRLCRPPVLPGGTEPACAPLACC